MRRRHLELQQQRHVPHKPIIASRSMLAARLAESLLIPLATSMKAKLQTAWRKKGSPRRITVPVRARGFQRIPMREILVRSLRAKL